MTIEHLVDLGRANTLFAEVVGAYVWGVRTGQDRILRMEFGDPHLTIQEPLRSTSGIQRVVEVLGRRVVTPTGQWSLLVEDGAWRIETSGSHCSRHGSDFADAERCLANINGQKVTSVAVTSDPLNLVIAFDLSGSLNVEFQSDVKDNSQWMLFFKEGDILSYEDKGKIVLEERG